LKQLHKVEGNTLDHTGIENNLLNRTQKAQQLRERMNKWSCLQLKASAEQKKQSLDLKDC
jgi:hypothetical protein